MIPQWAEQFIGIPFKTLGRDRSGVDCYGLVHLVYREIFGIHLDPFTGLYKSSDPCAGLESAQKIGVSLGGWYQVSLQKLRCADVIMFRDEGYTTHCGLVLDPAKRVMLHATKMHGSVLIENYGCVTWNNKPEYFLRNPALEQKMLEG